MITRLTDNNRPVSEINIIPFVDVLLVLLVISIATVPLALSNIGIDLPQSISGGALTDTKHLTVSITKEGKFYINDAPVTERQLAKKLAEYSNQNQIPVLLEADRVVRYEMLVELLDLLHKGGFQRIGFVTRDGR